MEVVAKRDLLELGRTPDEGTEWWQKQKCVLEVASLRGRVRRGFVTGGISISNTQRGQILIVIRIDVGELALAAVEPQRIFEKVAQDHSLRRRKLFSSASDKPNAKHGE